MTLLPGTRVMTISGNRGTVVGDSMSGPTRVDIHLDISNAPGWVFEAAEFIVLCRTCSQRPMSKCLFGPGACTC